ncbi:MAG: hypothetical protein AAGE18_15660 [Pseudomonadota bacterium]
MYFTSFNELWRTTNILHTSAIDELAEALGDDAVREKRNADEDRRTDEQSAS